jgi:eukaryotic-like serine/threonine-protein kinase
MNSASSSQRVPIAPAIGDGSSRTGSTPSGDACDPDQATVISQRPPGPASGSPRSTAHADLAKQLAGERLNHFQLLEYVGGGGMGAVFRALDTMLNRDVALKVLSRDQGADEETRRRFQNEAQSAARLDHENIARVYYVGEDRGLNYIVFEFIEGVNLRDVVERRGPLPLPEALSYTLQITHALSHACGRDVVHRDIKPSNVIITSGGRAKLVDMGLARLHQVQPDGEDLTASGVTLGTFDYISPEQARDPRGADVRSDIYSLGCTLYYMLTGQPPFPDGTVLQKLLQHNSDAPPDPREFDSSLPPGLSTLVSKMLAKDPLRRYQHPSELEVDLLLLAEQIGCRLLGAEQPAWPLVGDSPTVSTSLTRHLPWVVPVSLLLVSAVVADWPLPWIDPPEDPTALALREVRSRRRPRGSAGQKKPAIGNSGSINGSGGANRVVPPSEPISQRIETKADASNLAVDTDRDETPNQDAASPTAGSTGGAAEADGDTTFTLADRDAQGATPRPAAPDAKVGPSSDRPWSPPTDKPEEIASAEVVPEGLLVVGDGMKGPHRYATLAEACAVAKNGEVVELRYDGPHQESPLVLHNQRIEIRAGASRRPSIVFRPNDTNPIATERSMFNLSGGSLKLVGLDVELDLTQAAPSENWSLFLVEQADNLRLEHCVLTIRNATAAGETYHDKVAFFAVGAGAAADPMVMMPTGMIPLPPVQITLSDCLARGEADLLVDRDLKPVDFSCVNGLVAISERLFVAGEGAAMPQEGARVRVVLDHVTAMVRQGLCRIAASEVAPAMPEVEMRLTDSLVLSDDPDASLVEHVSGATASRLQAVFHWQAANTAYRGFRTFWKIAAPGSSRELEAKTYDEWTELWPSDKDHTHSEPLSWQPESPIVRLDTLTAADFKRDQAANASAGPPTDGSGRPAGVDFNRLP